MPSPPSAWAGFLRGINVGGRRKVPMAALAELVQELGGEEVRTYRQSGNVVFRATPGTAGRIGTAFPGRAEERFGFPVAMLLRSSHDLAGVLAGNPFLAAGVEASRLHVAFLADEPPASAVASLDPERSAPDAFAVRGREIYLHLPNGVGRSKLTNAYFDARLGTLSTARNWRTVTAVAGLVGASG